MEEISLTGATTLELSQTNHHHNHQHNHQHHGTCCKDHHPSHSQQPPLPQLSIDDLIESGSTEDHFRTLMTLVKMGSYEAFEVVASAFEKADLLNAVLQHTPDQQQQHSLVHWAAKRVDNVSFLEFLCTRLDGTTTNTQIINVPTKDDTGMRPLHWACTEGSIPHVACLLKHGAQAELTDQAGCTPLLIAAQYGHANLVAFLCYKARANLNAVDSSMDTALHWACYKGSMEVCGFLLHQTNQHELLLKQDAFGQTPLHLASLRGNTSVVRYLLEESTSTRQLQEMLLCQDKNEKTPLDLALQKNKPTVASVLQHEMDRVVPIRAHGSSLFAYYWKRYIVSNCRPMLSIHAWKTWLGCQNNDNVDEAPKLPFLITVGNMLLAGLWFPFVFTPVFSVGQGLLWDKTALHFFTICSMACMWIAFIKTWRTDPGLLNEDNPITPRLKQQYNDVLESLGSEAFNATNEVQLCHSCHVARPLRSKHCRVSRRCVLVFDHYCPFVGNTIGFNNYKWFYMFLWMLLLSCVGFYTEWIYYMVRSPSFSFKILFGGLYMGIFFCMDLGMVIYHSQLVLTNLTTNEHLNLARYKYLQNEAGQYRNPFDKGWLRNCIERCNSSTVDEGASYTVQAAARDLRQQEQASLVGHIDNEEDGDIV